MCLRIRPMNAMEMGRGDHNCINILNNQQCVLNTKYLILLSVRGGAKGYRFNVVLEDSKSQADSFVLCSIPVPQRPSDFSSK